MPRRRATRTLDARGGRSGASGGQALLRGAEYRDALFVGLLVGFDGSAALVVEIGESGHELSSRHALVVTEGRRGRTPDQGGPIELGDAPLDVLLQTRQGLVELNEQRAFHRGGLEGLLAPPDEVPPPDALAAG